MKRTNLIYIIFTCLMSFYGYGQTYHISTNNVLDIDASSCFLSNPSSVIQTVGNIKIIDNFGTILSNQDVNTFYNTRPETYAVLAGSCRWIEGSSAGNTYSLGGYNITIPLNLDSYYERIVNFGTVYFETYNSGENLIVDCETQFISATSSIIDSNIIEWEYSINSSVSVVSNSQNMRDLPFDFDNFDIDLNNYIGQSLLFRYKLVGGVYSPFNAYTIVKCSPLILGNPTVQDASCSYAPNNTGNFTITFDRPLDLASGEKLDFQLHKGSPTGPIFNQLLQSFPGTTYTWPDPLAADDYYLTYQTNPNGSVVSYGPITIQSPTPVSFSATWTDVDCFGDNTGSISITASGGAGNYEYSINNGANWAPFSNITTHTIINLSAANYQVKVKDSNNCIAQQ